MTNIVIERDNLTEIMQEWLTAQGVQSGEKLEIVFLEGEAIVRPQSTRHADLEKWLDEVTRKYDNVLRRLADS